MTITVPKYNWKPAKAPNPNIYGQVHRPGIPTPYAIFDGYGWFCSGGTVN